jgi:hypothetical protein
MIHVKLVARKSQRDGFMMTLNMVGEPHLQIEGQHEQRQRSMKVY